MGNPRRPSLVCATGSTFDGLPLAYSRQPAPDLDPWVQSLAVADILDREPSRRCGIFASTPSIRVLLNGKWRFHTADGVKEVDATEHSRICYFGAQTKLMEVEVEGPIRFFLLKFRPGAPPLDRTKTHADALDRIEIFDHGLPPHIGRGEYAHEVAREKWLDHFEYVTREILFSTVDEEPPQIARVVDHRVLRDSDLDLDILAKEFGVSRRTVERHVKQCFGLNPKRLVRRARALDMAAVLLNVAKPEDDDLYRLRYFDQSHLTREVQAHFTLAPGALAKQEAVLLRIDLEIRQLRRLEVMNGGAGITPPWRDPAAEPRA